MAIHPALVFFGFIALIWLAFLVLILYFGFNILEEMFTPKKPK
ncbi:MAG: hypothetical protein ABH850_04110 [Candidatus Micrarchaeota archaeon]